MKIEFDLPDWVDSENLYIISRNELVAYKLPNEPWKIKTVRCKRCGECCKVHPKNGAYYPLKKDGSCIHLENNQCKLGMEKLLACVLGEHTGKEYSRFNCSIEYKG